MRPLLAPVLAVRMNGYMFGSSSPFYAKTNAALAPMSDAQRRATIAYLFEIAIPDPKLKVFRRHSENAGGWLLGPLARRKLAWQAPEIAWLARAIRIQHADLDSEGLVKTLSILTAAVERSSDDLGQAEDDLRWLAAWMIRIGSLDWKRIPWDWVDPRIEKYAARLQTALGDEPQSLPDLARDAQDTFGPRARAAMLNVAGEADAATLLILLQGYGRSPRPSRRWRTEVAAKVAANPRVAVAARALVEAALSQPDPTQDGDEWIESWIHPDHQSLVRAAVWVCGVADPSPDMTSLLRDLGARSARSSGTRGVGTRSLTVANAVVAIMPGRVTEPASTGAVVGALLGIRQHASNRVVVVAVDKAIADVAANAHTTVSALLEQAVPTFGLDAAGERVERVDVYTATLRALVGAGRTEVSLTWTGPEGRVLKGVPAAVRRDHADTLAGLQRTVSDLRKEISVQRSRIENLMAEDRVWDPADWRAYYVGHPVVGLVARSLIWTVGDRSGLPERSATGEWQLVDADGRPIQPIGDIRLWHPLGKPVAEIEAWRALVTDGPSGQPFKQAFREIYLITPAEEETGTYSNRFSAHVLRWRPASALMRAREWRVPGLGGWDFGEEGEASRRFGSWRAYLYVSLAEQAEFAAEFCVTDRVRFEQADDQGEWHAVRLADVDALEFSEAMRDVDLFVGVASIGTDPTWVTGNTDRYLTYWEDFSFGALSASAAVRKDALARILPRTKLRDTARIAGRFLEVDGKLRSYKIHLGSGNILMSPHDAYLCIVADNTSRQPTVRLPFEEDGRLSLILSKAFLLADDDAITDPDIVRQIRPGRR